MKKSKDLLEGISVNTVSPKISFDPSIWSEDNSPLETDTHSILIRDDTVFLSFGKWEDVDNERQVLVQTQVSFPKDMVLVMVKRLLEEYQKTQEEEAE